ncbi:PglL family O-oligosaccharyltransferase [Ramlibacter sp.]|uniref:PglL family O-oligosaccharyltransferase n=1 Tax=Ramlibacter sp. TaxID=1917967 RepID=UPI0035B40609
MQADPLRRPGGRLDAAWGLAAAALVALPWLNPFAPGPSAAIAPWLFAAACGLALWLLAAARGGAPRAPLAWLALGVVLWAGVASRGLPPEAVMLAGGLGLVVAASALTPGAGRDGLVAGAQAGLIVAAALNAVVALVQYTGHSEAFAPWLNTAGPGLAFGNLRQPNHFASLCWLGIAAVIWAPLPLPRWARLALLLLLGAASATSLSRTPLPQAALLVVLALAWPGARGRRLVWCGVAIACAVAASYLLPALLETATGGGARRVWTRLSNEEGCSGRLVLWRNVLELIGQRPLGGWGWGELDYAHFMHLYAGPRFCDILDNAHNLPLHLAVELGVPAALVLVLVALVWVWRRAPWREADPLRQLAWVWLGLLALHSMVEYPLWYGPFQITAGLALGWLALPTGAATASAAPAPQGDAVEAPVAPHRAGLVFALALGVANVYAAWDYLRVSQIYLLPEQRAEAWRDDTLGHIRRSWLFAGQARFAELTLTALTRDNAAWVHVNAEIALHYSPEPRVIERAIESATWIEAYDEALLHLARYRAAFPADYAAWQQAQKRPMLPPSN